MLAEICIGVSALLAVVGGVPAFSNSEPTLSIVERGPQSDYLPNKQMRVTRDSFAFSPLECKAEHSKLPLGSIVVIGEQTSHPVNNDYVHIIYRLFNERDAREGYIRKSSLSPRLQKPSEYLCFVKRETYLVNKTFCSKIWRLGVHDVVAPLNLNTTWDNCMDTLVEVEFRHLREQLKAYAPLEALSCEREMFLDQEDPRGPIPAPNLNPLANQYDDDVDQIYDIFESCNIL